MHQATIIGIDIAKDHLDVHRLPDGQAARFENTNAGIKALARWLGKAPCRILFEATGRYHRNLETQLATAGHAVVKVNPARARRFAQAIGQNAKSDRIDAAMLARMGMLLKLEARPVRSETMNDLRELYVARLALIKDQTACRNRMYGARHRLVRRQLRAREHQIETQITAIDAEIQKRIDDDNGLSRRLAILTSIPGIGSVAAISIIIEMPEIGSMTPKQTASLAGLAPLTRESGTWKGQSYIGGGRAGLRKSLYMPALVAVRYNEPMAYKYRALRAAGKPAKVALTAIMRKLIILANTLIHEDREWTETRP